MLSSLLEMEWVFKPIPHLEYTKDRKWANQARKKYWNGKNFPIPVNQKHTIRTFRLAWPHLFQIGSNFLQDRGIYPRVNPGHFISWKKKILTVYKGDAEKRPKSDIQSQSSMSKMNGIFFIFLGIINLGDQFWIEIFFSNFKFWAIYFLKWPPIFDLI